MDIRSAVALDADRCRGKVMPMAAPKHPPNRIREWRRHRGLTLEQLAELVGSNNQTIGRYERGERSVTIDVLLQLAPALGCKPADLLPDPESILSDEERRLIRASAELSPEDRAVLLRIAQTLVAGSKENGDDAPRLKRRIS